MAKNSGLDMKQQVPNVQAYESNFSILPASSKDPFPDLPPYTPPTGLVSCLPASLIPYAELMRLHRPAGYYAFYFPHLFGTLYAAALWSPNIVELLRVNFLFAVGSLILRGAACTWNDTLDAPYDRLVARCRHRPVARGAVSPFAAHLFTLFQSVLGAAILFQLPSICLIPAALLIFTMGIYPFAKRVTYYPQVVLGFSLALGQLVGAAGMGMDPFRQTSLKVNYAMGSLYLSNVVNAIVYDAVYAHQDLKDDLKAGVKSVAVAWQSRTKPVLCFLSVLEVALLGVSGYLFKMGSLYFVSAVAGTATVLGSMIWAVRLDVPEDCGKWFKWSIWLTGGTLSSGLLAEYLALF